VSTYALPDSDAYTPTAVGTYCYNVSYAGDTNYNPVLEQSDTECFTVTQPNFTVLKTNVPGNGNPVVPGSTIPYTVTIQNVGDGAGPAVITDVLPSYLTMQGTPKCQVTSPDTCAVANPSGTTWTFSVSLGVGDSAVVTFSATVSATQTADVVNTAKITTGNCNPNGIVTAPSLKSNAVTIQCSSTVTNPVPNFTVTKTDTPGNGNSVTAGSTIPYTVAIKNVGDGAGTATITDNLPSNLTLASTPAPACTAKAPDTCTVGGSGSKLTFTVSLAAGNTATATFSAVVAAGTTGSVTNTATITTGPCNTSSGCSSTVSNPIPLVTTPAVVFTPPPPAPVIAFTGAYLESMWAVAAGLLGLGGLMVLMARRRRRGRHAS
jgi:fimbrial isopeptide formation D2 family protein